MGYEQDYEALLATLHEIPPGEVVAPRLRVADAAQEADDLYECAVKDRAALVASGLAWDVVESLPVRAGALRHAESIWIAERKRGKAAHAEFRALVPRARALRKEMSEVFRYAYRSDRRLLRTVKGITRRRGSPELIQQLHSLAAVGRANTADLRAVSFDMPLLHAAEELGDAMAESLASWRSMRSGMDSRFVRDRAYTYVVQGMAEVRGAGKFAFRRDRERAAQYASAYYREHRGQGKRRSGEPTSSDDLQARPDRVQGPRERAGDALSRAGGLAENAGTTGRSAGVGPAHGATTDIAAGVSP